MRNATLTRIAGIAGDWPWPYPRKKSIPPKEKPRCAGISLERTTGIEPATLSLGS